MSINDFAELAIRLVGAVLEMLPREHRSVVAIRVVDALNATYRVHDQAQDRLDARKGKKP